MYNEKPKMKKKKIIEIILLLIALIWVILFLVDYIRYIDGKHPLLALKTTHTYPDGEVTEYYALGYTYRRYSRESLTGEELVPFWVMMQKTDAVDDLPVTYKDYNVPKNPYKTDKYKGLLYYWDKSTLVGTYKCVNTDNDCEKATGGWDIYNTKNKDYLAKEEAKKIEFAYTQFAFVDDSLEQDVEYGDLSYQRTILLVDILNNEIIARYSDIKQSVYDDLYDISKGDNYKYIVEEYKTKNWGIIELTEDGEINEILPFEYQSISYDEDTGYYILAKDDEWYIYDLENDEIKSNKTSDIIYDVWTNDNQTTYYKIGKDRTIGDDSYTEFKVYRIDGQQFTTTEGDVLIYATGTYLMLVNKDNTIRYIDYSGEELEKVNLYFHSFYEDDYTLPCFKIDSKKENYMILTIYHDKALGSEYDRVTVLLNRQN